jgi:hypothetical protein
VLAEAMSVGVPGGVMMRRDFPLALPQQATTNIASPTLIIGQPLVSSGSSTSGCTSTVGTRAQSTLSRLPAPRRRLHSSAKSVLSLATTPMTVKQSVSIKHGPQGPNNSRSRSSDLKSRCPRSFFQKSKNPPGPPSRISQLSIVVR